MCELVRPIGLRRSGRFPAGGVDFTAVAVTMAGSPERIVELAAVRLRADGTVLGTLSTAITPGRGTALEEVVGRFVLLARDSVLLLPDAHDLRPLVAALTKAGVPMPMLPGVRPLDLPVPATGAALDRARLLGRLVTTSIRTRHLQFTEQPRFRRLPPVPPTPHPQPTTEGRLSHNTRPHPSANAGPRPNSATGSGTEPAARAAATAAPPPPPATPPATTTAPPPRPTTPQATTTAPPPPPTTPPAAAGTHPWAAYATMSIGLCLMVFTLIALFGGASAAFGLLFGAVGVGALLLGRRHLVHYGPKPPNSERADSISSR